MAGALGQPAVVHAGPLLPPAGASTPLPSGEFPTKEQFADYLEGYARHFGLTVRTGVQVTGLQVTGDGFELATSSGPLHAARVVIATGPNTVPRIPEASGSLDPLILQVHGSGYRNPSQLPDGDVVVVGAATSGAEIALEIAGSGRRTYLAGRPTPHIPDAVFRYAGAPYWAFINHVLTLGTPVGRKVAEKLPTRGAPLIRVSMAEVQAAGVTPLPRLTEVTDGLPVFDGQSVGRPGSVVWTTGFRPDLGWLPGVAATPYGWPVTRRGLVEAIPGLAFVGMPFQYSLTSGLIGGVGRDADYVAEAFARSDREPLALAVGHRKR